MKLNQFNLISSYLGSYSPFYKTLLLIIISTLVSLQCMAEDRIFCKNSPAERSAYLNTLRTDSSEGFYVPSVAMTDEKGKLLARIIDVLPLYSDLSKASTKIFVLGEKNSGKKYLFESDLNLASRASKSQFITESSGIDSGMELKLNELSLPFNAMNGNENILIANSEKQELILYKRDPKQIQHIQLKREIANPRWADNGTKIIFETFSQNGKIISAVYDLATQALIDSGVPSKSNLHQTILFWSPDIKIWQDIGPSVPYKKTLYISVENLGTHKLAETSSPESSVFFLKDESKGKFAILWNEFEWENSPSEDETPSVGISLKSGQTNYLLIDSSTGNVLSQNKAVFPDSLRNKSKNLVIYPNWFMREILWTNELVTFTTDLVGPMVQLNLETKAWKNLGLTTSYHCFHPRAVLETL